MFEFAWTHWRNSDGIWDHLRDPDDTTLRRAHRTSGTDAYFSRAHVTNAHTLAQDLTVKDMWIACLRAHQKNDSFVSCSVKTTPQVTHFLEAKVCNNLATDEIDDHRIQSDDKCISELQNPEGKTSVLDIASAW